MCCSFGVCVTPSQGLSALQSVASPAVVLMVFPVHCVQVSFVLKYPAIHSTKVCVKCIHTMSLTYNVQIEKFKGAVTETVTSTVCVNSISDELIIPWSNMSVISFRVLCRGSTHIWQFQWEIAWTRPTFHENGKKMKKNGPRGGRPNFVYVDPPLNFARQTTLAYCRAIKWKFLHLSVFLMTSQIYPKLYLLQLI